MPTPNAAPINGAGIPPLVRLALKSLFTEVLGLAAANVLPTFNVVLERLVLDLDDWNLVAGAVNLTPGTRYFLSNVTAGRLVGVAPVTVGHYRVEIGIATSTKQLLIDIQKPVLIS